MDTTEEEESDFASGTFETLSTYPNGEESDENAAAVQTQGNAAKFKRQNTHFAIRKKPTRRISRRMSISKLKKLK